jgi:hypothetical protein
MSDRLPRSARSVSLLRRGGVVAIVGFALAAAAVPDLVGELVPDPSLPAPNPAIKTRQASVQPGPEGCPDTVLPRLAKRPFGPGEWLAFEADIFGYDVAAFEARVEQPLELDGQRVLPVYAEVHSDFLLRVAASFDGEMRSWLDPDTLEPRRHVWRMRGKTPKNDFYGRSDAVFQGRKVGLKSHFVSKAIGEDVEEKREEQVFNWRPGSFDLLSVIYDARARELKVGSVLCSQLQIYGSANRWKAVVEGRERIDVDYDERMAYRLTLDDGRAQRNKVKATAWISDDDERLPMRLLIENEHGAFDLRLDDVDR